MANANEREALERLLAERIRSMEEEGLVDHRFALARFLKSNAGPLFFANLIPTFCSDTRANLRNFTFALDQPTINYHLLDELCIKIQGGTVSIGLFRMGQKCRELRQAIDANSRAMCIAALNALTDEFIRLEERMLPIIQLERWILACSTQHP